MENKTLMDLVREAVNQRISRMTFEELMAALKEIESWKRNPS